MKYPDMTVKVETINNGALVKVTFNEDVDVVLEPATAVHVASMILVAARDSISKLQELAYARTTPHEREMLWGKK